MFCRFCGKQIEDDSAFCGNCGAAIEKEEEPVKKAEEVAEPFFAEEKPLPAVNPRMEGFGRALTGVIFTVVAMVLLIYACVFIDGAQRYNSYYGMYTSEEDVIAAFFLLMGSIALSIISVVFGAKSIGTFKRVQREKPVATLVLGIISLAEGALILFVNTILFFPLLILLTEI